MKTNRELKDLHLPVCNWRDFLKFQATLDNPYLPQKDIDALDAYFNHFLPPNDGKCWKCGHRQSGLLGRFGFGIQSDEGQCRTGDCSWPARAIHRNVGPIKSLEMLLQYHPDVVTWDK